MDRRRCDDCGAQPDHRLILGSSPRMTDERKPYFFGLNQLGEAGGVQLRCMPMPFRKARRIRPA